jgi:dihydrolipoamide dehydrogenase
MGTEVTLVEFMPTIVPLEDEEVAKQLGRSLKKIGIKVMVESSVESVTIEGRCLQSECKKQKKEKKLSKPI